MNEAPTQTDERVAQGRTTTSTLSKAAFLDKHEQNWQEGEHDTVILLPHREYKNILAGFNKPSDLLRDKGLAQKIRDAYKKAKKSRAALTRDIPDHLQNQVILAPITDPPPEIDAFLRFTDEYRSIDGQWWPKRFADYQEDKIQLASLIAKANDKQTVDKITAHAQTVQAQFENFSRLLILEKV